MWIVMTSSAKMPNSCRGTYRNIALVHISQEYTAKGLRPAMISPRAKGVCKLHAMPRAILHLGRYSVGKTPKCAYQRFLREAEERCRQLNNAATIAEARELWTWGGSA